MFEGFLKRSVLKLVGAMYSCLLFECEAIGKPDFSKCVDILWFDAYADIFIAVDLNLKHVLLEDTVKFFPVS